MRELRCYLESVADSRVGLFPPALTNAACGAPFVSNPRQISRSSVSPAEQVGEQIEGIGGWRPSFGSGGRCAGCTDGGAIGGELLLQLVSSTASAISIGAGSGNFLLSILNHSVDARAPDLFLGALGALSQAAGFGYGAPVLGEFLPRLGGVSPRTGASRALNAGGGQCSGEPQSECPEQRGFEVGKDHTSPNALRARTRRARRSSRPVRPPLMRSVCPMKSPRSA